MAREKKLSTEAAAAWQVDQLDPDNWFDIPEFGVSPGEVDFVGFSSPIVGPDDRSEIHGNVRELLRVLRALARHEFKTLRELREAALRGYDALDVGATLAPAEVSAVTYGLAHSALQSAVSTWLSQSARLRNLSSGASIVAAWAYEGSARALAAALRQKEGAALGGKKGALTRRKVAVEFDQVEAAARRLGWPDVTRGVNKTVAKSFPVTAARIGQILRSRLSEK